MTDEQIIQAVDLCANGQEDCRKCPLHSVYSANCIKRLMNITLDLIKRQQAEIERLKEIANPKCQQCVEQTRKNSIIELADELKHRMLYWSYDFQYNSEYIAADREIDDIVKEMTEGSK